MRFWRLYHFVFPKSPGEGNEAVLLARAIGDGFGELALGAAEFDLQRANARAEVGNDLVGPDHRFRRPRQARGAR